MAEYKGLYIVIVVVIQVIFISFADGAGCILGWELHGESCYKTFPKKASWTEAYTFCKALGGQLASPETLEEQHYLEQYLAQEDVQLHYNIYWIGGIDLDLTDTWRWTSTQEVAQYGRWGPNEPMQGAEHCMCLYGTNQYTWADHNCDDREGFLCEAPMFESNAGIVG